MIRMAEWEGHTYVFDWPDSDHGLWEGPLMNWKDEHIRHIREKCRDFRVAVQAGGGCGMYPKFLGSLFKQVYSFEPDPVNFNHFAANCKETHITKFNAALGDSHTMVRIIPGAANNLGTHTTQYDVNSHIPTLMIDDLSLLQCDLIMLDIEGFEQFALKGAERTLTKLRPLVFAERGDGCTEMMADYEYCLVAKSAADVIYMPKEFV